MAFLEIKNVTKAYGDGPDRTEVLDDISLEIEEGEFVSIDLSDTGKGIPSSKFKTVFQPGFTTKKRGWGLGYRDWG